MINGQSKINPAYTQTPTRTNNVDKFDADDWNAISEAVATAHAKINAMTDASASSLTGTAVTIESTDTNVDITSSNSITITAQQDIDFFNEGGINGVTLSDIITVVEYFKNNPETGMTFAA